MNPLVGWGLAAAAVIAGQLAYGWRGVVLAISVVVFWLLLQFSRTLRVMRGAAQRPAGTVDSAVMLNAKLHIGMTMLQILPLTKSLGRKVAEGDDPERWCWTDPGGASVSVELRRGKVTAWVLERRPAPPGS